MTYPGKSWTGNSVTKGGKGGIEARQRLEERGLKGDIGSGTGENADEK